jgi:hypothetical protein
LSSGGIIARRISRLAFKDIQSVKTVLRGIFLTSENPDQTANFYRTVAGLDLEEIGSADTYRYWKIDKEGVQLAIHDAEKFADYTHPVQRDSNVTHLYFQVASQPQFLEHLKTMQVDPISTDDVVVTVVDPDGRKVMFGTA